MNVPVSPQPQQLIPPTPQGEPSGASHWRLNRRPPDDQEQARPVGTLTVVDSGPRIGSRPSADIAEYRADLEEPKRSTLRHLRQTILEVVPEAQEGISYRHPAFRLEGKVIAGFGAFKNHLSYLPIVVPYFQPFGTTWPTTRHRTGRFNSQSTRRCRSLS